MKIVILGLSITSSWGNGHATTFRALIRALHRRGHHVIFLEEDQPWYAENRDMPNPPFCETHLYTDLLDLQRRFTHLVRGADAVMVGSYVPRGIEVGQWVCETTSGPTLFYDIDTPVTIAALERGECEYLDAETIPLYDFYLSFSGGRILERLSSEFHARQPVPFYCSVDTDLYYPEAPATGLEWDLGYMGTYAVDRQPSLEKLLLEPARNLPHQHFCVAGPMYPAMTWPQNVTHTQHIVPEAHRAFYNSQRFTLNLTRQDMIRAGHSPSVRLFEAAACGVPIISDYWVGLEDFFELEHEIFVARTSADVIRLLGSLTETERRAAAERARERILREHTSAHRAGELEALLEGTAAPARRDQRELEQEQQEEAVL